MSAVSSEEVYGQIINNLKIGFTSGLALGIVFLVGMGVKAKFFYSRQKPTDKGKAVLSSLGFEKVISSLNKYELTVASQLVNPADMTVTFKDVAGLDSIVTSLKANIIIPLLTQRFLKRKSRHLLATMGVLLSGPPGCGKTLIAKATAKEANARFLNLEIPTLTDKWYGESQKFAMAVFTLAEKIQPCIIFIDEIDTFLRSRGQLDHEATAMVKAQFMILWDGLQSQESNGIIIMGATNRPFDVDEAILRRMPTKLEVLKPNVEQRTKILELFLAEEDLLLDDVDLDRLAELSEGLSGSDLKEMCRGAFSAPIKENAQRILEIVRRGEEEEIDRLLGGLRRVKFEDFEEALKILKRVEEWKDGEAKATCLHHPK